MPKKTLNVAVVGSRGFDRLDWVRDAMPQVFRALALEYPKRKLVVYSGGAQGVDAEIASLVRRRFSETMKVVEVLPDWAAHGRSAGIVRNEEIVNAADIVIAFWDGKSPGTKNSIDRALFAGKRLYVVRRFFQGRTSLHVNDPIVSALSATIGATLPPWMA